MYYVNSPNLIYFKGPSILVSIYCTSMHFMYSTCSSAWIPTTNSATTQSFLLWLHHYMLTSLFWKFSYELVPHIDYLLIAMPPKEKSFKIVIKQLREPPRNNQNKIVTPIQQRGHRKYGHPLIKSHLFPNPPSISQMHIDNVQILLFEVALFRFEVL